MLPGLVAIAAPAALAAPLATVASAGRGGAKALPPLPPAGGLRKSCWTAGSVFFLSRGTVVFLLSTSRGPRDHVTWSMYYTLLQSCSRLSLVLAVLSSQVSFRVRRSPQV